MRRLRAEAALMIGDYSISRVCSWSDAKVYCINPTILAYHPDCWVPGFRVQFGCVPGCGIRTLPAGLHVAFGPTREKALASAERMTRYGHRFVPCLCGMTQTDLDFIVGPDDRVCEGVWEHLKPFNCYVRCRLCGRTIGPAY